MQGCRAAGRRYFAGGGDKPLQVGFEGTAGIQGVGKGVGLSEVPPGVVEFVFLLPVFEAVGFDEGEEVDAELGFAAAGEFEEGDGPTVAFENRSRACTLIFNRNTFTAMIEGIRESTIEAGMMEAAEIDRGIEDLYRTVESDGVFCYTFFKAVAVKR